MPSLTANCFFAEFSPAACISMQKMADFQLYSPEEVLFEEGTESNSVILVMEGEVEIFRRLPHGQMERLVVVVAGDYLGELSLLDGVKRATGARALSPLQVGILSRESLRAVLRTEPVEVTLGLFQRLYHYLQQTNERLLTEIVRKEKMQLVGEMAAGIIHDFKNPLTGIKLATELLEERHQDKETHQCTSLILAQSDRMVQMAQELLDFSRGRPVLVKETIPMRALLEKFQWLNEEYLRQAKITLHVSAGDEAVTLDMGRMLRVLQNLVGNAVDAMAPGGGVIEIAGTTRGEAVELMVRDRGPGLPEVIRDRLFEPFVTHGKKNGTGLGMALVKATIEAHGGGIRFETELGVGTTFFLTMPRAE